MAIFRGVTARKLRQKHDRAYFIRECGTHVSSLETSTIIFKKRKAAGISIFKHLVISSFKIFGLSSMMANIASSSTSEVHLERG